MDLLSAKEEKVNRHANEGSWVLREAIARRAQLLITFTAFVQSAGEQLRGGDGYQMPFAPEEMRAQRLLQLING